MGFKKKQREGGNSPFPNVQFSFIMLLGIKYKGGNCTHGFNYS